MGMLFVFGFSFFACGWAKNGVELSDLTTHLDGIELPGRTRAVLDMLLSRKQTFSKGLNLVGMETEMEQTVTQGDELVRIMSCSDQLNNDGSCQFAMDGQDVGEPYRIIVPINPSRPWETHFYIPPSTVHRIDLMSEGAEWVSYLSISLQAFAEEVLPILHGNWTNQPQKHTGNINQFHYAGAHRTEFTFEPVFNVQTVTFKWHETTHDFADVSEVKIYGEQTTSSHAAIEGCESSPGIDADRDCNEAIDDDYQQGFGLMAGPSTFWRVDFAGEITVNGFGFLNPPNGENSINDFWFELQFPVGGVLSSTSPQFPTETYRKFTGPDSTNPFHTMVTFHEQVGVIWLKLYPTGSSNPTGETRTRWFYVLTRDTTQVQPVTSPIASCTASFVQPGSACEVTFNNQYVSSGGFTAVWAFYGEGGWSPSTGGWAVPIWIEWTLNSTSTLYGMRLITGGTNPEKVHRITEFDVKLYTRAGLETIPNCSFRPAAHANVSLSECRVQTLGFWDNWIMWNDVTGVDKVRMGVHGTSNVGGQNAVVQEVYMLGVALIEDEEVVETLGLVDEVMDDIKVAYVEERDVDDVRLGEVNDKISSCSDIGVAHDAVLEAATLAQKAVHEDCRAEEESLFDHDAIQCGRLVVFLSTVAPPECTPPQPTRGHISSWTTMLNTGFSYFNIKLPEYLPLRNACQQSSSALELKIEECRLAQVEYENLQCEWRVHRVDRCEDMHACYDNAVGAHDDMVEEVLPIAEHRVGTVRVVSYVDCLVVDKMNGGDSVMACGPVKSDDYSEYNNTFPDVEGRPPCTDEGVEEYPGSDQWHTFAYSGLSPKTPALPTTGVACPDRASR